MKKVLFLLLVLAMMVSACGSETAVNTPETAATQEPAQATAVEPTAETPHEMVHVRLPMGYIPDPQYAPFYVAVEKGYYADEGIEIEFDYSFETDGVALVGSNNLQFAVVSGEQVILARAQQVPVVYVLAWYQKFPIAVVSKASAGIEKPEDLVGRSVGLPGFFGASYVGYSGLLSANEIDPSSVNAQEVGFTQVETLLTDKVDAVVGYANNEPLQLENQGEAINVLSVSDYIDMVANGIITNEETIKQNPDLVKGFVRATLRGLADTIADPDGAYEISKKYVEGLDDSRMNVLTASIEMWKTDQLGITNPAAWENTQEVLLGMGFLDKALPDLTQAYDNQFATAVQSDLP